MELKLKTPLEVNRNQFNWVRSYCKGLLAHRTDKEGKFWIKPLCYMGHKNEIEKALIKLQ